MWEAMWWKNGSLSYYGMAEGRVRLDVGFSVTTYKMEIFITDHPIAVINIIYTMLAFIHQLP